jgi:hypothetical protein
MSLLDCWVTPTEASHPHRKSVGISYTVSLYPVVVEASRIGNQRDGGGGSDVACLTP